MPSSLIFAGLVATWLAVLVPMAARRRQQTPRPSDAALSGRVLERPSRGKQEVTTMDDARAGRTRTGPTAPEPSDQPDHADEYDQRDGTANRRPPEPGYRPGRGGYDPEAAALAAQAKYAFRQRMVLVLVLFAVISAALAVTLRSTDTWYLHGAVDLSLVGYLVYLRRQVRMEQAIRQRRAARGAGSRRGPSAADEIDEHPRLARTGRSTGPRRRWGTVADAVAAREAVSRAGPTDPDADTDTPTVDRAGRRAGTNGSAGEPRGDVDRPHDGDTSADGTEDTAEDTAEPQRPALPRLRSTPLPLPPPGATRLELDDEDPELHDLGSPQPRGYRRAAGQ